MSNDTPAPADKGAQSSEKDSVAASAEEFFSREREEAKRRYCERHPDEDPLRHLRG